MKVYAIKIFNIQYSMVFDLEDNPFVGVDILKLCDTGENFNGYYFFTEEGFKNKQKAVRENESGFLSLNRVELAKNDWNVIIY